MQPDDELCLCFHVTCRKVLNWIRIHHPRRAAELGECFGAGTGCGWCRPWLEELFERSGSPAQPGGGDPQQLLAGLPDPADYSLSRAAWRTAKKMGSDIQEPRRSPGQDD